MRARILHEKYFLPPRFNEYSGAMKRYSPVFYRLAAANFLYFMGNSLFILFPVYLKNLGAAESYIGFMNGADKIFIIAGAVTIGSIMQGRDSVRLLRLGYAVSIAAFASYTAITEPSWLVLPIRMVHGIGFSLSMILGTTIIFGSVDLEDAVQAIGIYGVTGAVTNALSPFLGEMLLSHGVPHRLIFILSAVLSAASLALTFLIHPEKGPVQGASPAAARGSLRLLGDPKFFLLSTATLIFGGMFGVIVTYLPNYVRSVTDFRFSWFFITHITVLIIVRFTFLGSMKRLKGGPLIMGCFLTGAASCLLMNAVRFFPLFILTGALYGITHGVLYPVLNTITVTTVDERDRGAANALFTAFFSGGTMVFSFALGRLIDSTGSYLSAFNFTAGAAGAAIAIIAFITSRYGPLASGTGARTDTVPAAEEFEI